MAKIKIMKPSLSAILLMIFIFLVPCQAFADEHAPMPTAAAESGVLDLSRWSFEQDGIAPLDGEWAFYWQQLLTPDEIRSSIPSAQYVAVPSIWSSYSVQGDKLPNQGYATYRLRILLDDREIGKSFSVWVPNASTAYRLWINGVEAGGNGTVGTSRTGMMPKNFSKAIAFVPQTAELDIVIQVSNYVQRKGGLWDSLELGYTEQVSHAQVQGAVTQAGLAGVILIMGFYHLVLFFLRPESREALYFSGLCLTIGIRMLVTGQTLLIQHFPILSWEFGVKIEYWGFIFAVPFFISYIKTLFPHEMSKWVVRFVAVCAIIMGTAVLFLPASAYTHAMLPYQILIVASFLYVGIVLGLAVYRKRIDVWLNFGAWLFIFVTAVNDTLFYNLAISTGDLFPYGILAAIITQSINLSLRYSRAFREVKHLSTELAELNESLEDKIEQRTAELEQANQARLRLMSNISHELGTPLSVAQGYVKGMIDGIVPIGDPKHLSLIYNKTKTLERMIKDLRELSNLESRQISFAISPVLVRGFIEQVAEANQHEFVQAGFKLETSIPEELRADNHYVLADVIRLEQVMLNFLSNARKHLGEDGRVEIGMRSVDHQGVASVAVYVADNGIGISGEVVPFVFDRYFQADQKVGTRQGMGLGLAICKEIIEIHGGTVGVQSEIGKGSTFYFVLPAADRASLKQEEGDADEREQNPGDRR